MSNIKTVLHVYSFDIRNADEKAAYVELCAKLKKEGARVFCTWSGGKGYWLPFAKVAKTGLAVELETSHIFDNQWNTAPIPGFSEKGYRVFDWAEDYPINMPAHFKRGHYLVHTVEMAEVRRNTAGCGYCGKQEPAQKGNVFCPHCIDSEYLNVDNLHLTRMQAVDCKTDRAELSEAEKAYLLPLYKAAQTHGTTERGRARIKKAYVDLHAEFERSTRKATIKRDGFLWLMDHGLNTANVIYYDHTDKFSFGWRNPVDDILVSEILEVISEFPFNYEIKCADGRLLSN